MSMLIPGEHQLAEPVIVTVEEFEPLLAEFKTFVVDYVAQRSPPMRRNSRPAWPMKASC